MKKLKHLITFKILLIKINEIIILKILELQQLIIDYILFIHFLNLHECLYMI